jgi:hypothetical protein
METMLGYWEILRQGRKQRHRPQMLVVKERVVGRMLIRT